MRPASIGLALVAADYNNLLQQNSNILMESDRLTTKQVESLKSLAKQDHRYAAFALDGHRRLSCVPCDQPIPRYRDR